MKSITTSKLRERLFPSLKSAALGDSFIVKTKMGPVLITAAPKPVAQDVLEAKIPGRITGDLDDADNALRDHVEWPK